ncbi:unnamed protein product [Rotaria socialis]|uniref:Phosphoinositide phospholipase C n=1 Tax=Rotaria socialis TaxID=392032 RepID=A0A820LW45_9BILA|nr:unnamed protein product [Rotaria socialis]CAF4363702.1 unnamed protein product [Rotaria socialis]
MNGEPNKEEDIDENNMSNVCSSSNSTTSSASCRSASVSTENFLRKHQQINRRRAFFHDSLIVKSNKNNNACNENNNDNNHSLIMDGSQQILTTNNENDGLSNDEIPTIVANINEENHTNKSLKRKVVSFSTMPFEKKVADVSDCLRYMQEGSDFLKVRSYARQFRRLYKLNATLTAISWYPTSKKPSKATITIDSIKETRLGKTTERLREYAHQFQNESLFSIIYTNEPNQYVSLDLVASSADEANIWVTGLSCLIADQGKSSSLTGLEDRQQMRDRWLRDAFAVGLPSLTGDSEHLNQNDDRRISTLNSIDEEEAIRLLIDYGIAEDKAKVRLQEVQMTKSEDARGYFTTEELVSAFKELSTRPEIYHLLVRYSRNQDFLSTEDLTLFLEAEQGMSKITREKCADIIHEFEPSTEAKILGHLGIDGFTNYLLSPECDIFNPNNRSICQEMNHPLNHYFIASSHNTFLLADQLKGPSSVDGFIHALMRGCRCLELHCFDGPDGQPLIHNGTLTSRIPLNEALEAINNYAFETSSYPLILCLELQCGISQQERIAQLLLETFSDKLYLDNSSMDANTTFNEYRPLPSPNDLRGRIIIKSKKIPQLYLNDNTKDYGEVTDDEDCYEDNRRRSKKDINSKRHRKLARAISDLVCLLRSAPFEDFTTSLNEQQSGQVCTFSENAALRLATSDAEEFVNYNKRFLSRISPGTWRVDSSNVNPQDFWNVGCQMVAMNYQTAGKFMDVYFGRFLSNGGCGYVLKPTYLRYDNAATATGASSSMVSGRFSTNLYSSNTPQILHIKVISALHLPKPEQAELKTNSVDPYVVVQIFGVPRDCDEVRTKTVYHNWESPQFNEAFEFEIAFPELTVVRFVVLDDESLDYDFIGQYTLPFDCIQPGYRHVHLYTIGGDIIANAYLFVHIVVNSKSLAVKPRRSLSRYRRSLLRRKLRVAAFRPVNHRQIDDLFKSVIQPLETAFEYRHAVEQSLCELNEMCGLPDISNVKQCVRKIASRLQKANLVGSVSIRNQSGVPIFEYSTTLPQLSRQSVVALEEVINRCRALVDNGSVIHKKLFNVQTEVYEMSKDIPKLLETSGLRGKKFTKAIDNFSYNLALLNGQTDLLNKAKQDANIAIQQILEAAETTHLLIQSEQS